MFIQQFEQLYKELISVFPHFLQPFVSIALAVLLVYSVFQTIKKNFIFIIVLIILLPTSVPILKDVLDAVIQFVKFLLGH